MKILCVSRKTKIAKSSNMTHQGTGLEHSKPGRMSRSVSPSGFPVLHICQGRKHLN